MEELLVFGRTGQVAQELSALAPRARFLGREDADLRDPDACAAAVRRLRPRLVINAAAYTAVDRAEAEPEQAGRINADAPGAIAVAAAKEGAPFLHVSTDYVFDGTGTAPRAEDAPTAPVNTYGATKLRGEQAIAAAGGQAAILRTSWVFSAHGGNFVKTMLRLGVERAEIAVVDDQIGGPTPAADIAAALLTMGQAMLDRPWLRGVYHFAGAPDASWADFARAIMDRSGLPCEVRPIATSDYPTPARRPLNSRLECSAIARDFGITRPDWRTGLDQVLARLKEQA